MAASKTSAQALQAENQKLHREIEALKQQLKKLEHDNRESNEGIQMLFNDLYKKHQKLQVIDKLKSDFISTVSHELKTPLTMIKAGISQVHDGVLGDVTQDQKEALDGVFTMIALEEKDIRNNFAARTTDLLRRVFGLQD